MFRDTNPKHWQVFAFYYNPDNPRLFVAKRIGLGWTLNFARPMAWVLSFGSIAITIGVIVALNR